MKKVSMKTIADSLHITVDAVSKALRDSPEISKETKAKVNKKALELGYIKSNIGSMLRSGNSRFVAIVINSFLNPFFSVMTTFLFDELNDRGYTGVLIFCNCHYLTESAVKQILANDCAGVITLVEPTAEVVRLLHLNNIPCLLLGIPSNNSLLSTVSFDDYDGGCQVGDYFLNNNYHNALYITDSKSITSENRKAGFLSKIKKCETVVCQFEMDGFSSSLINSIKNNKIDFIFCFSDFLAERVKNLCNSANLDVKIIGFDNIYKHFFLYSRVQSINYSYKESSKCAVELLIERIKNPDLPVIQKVFPVKLSEK